MRPVEQGASRGLAQYNRPPAEREKRWASARAGPIGFRVPCLGGDAGSKGLVRSEARYPPSCARRSVAQDVGPGTRCEGPADSTRRRNGRGFIEAVVVRSASVTSYQLTSRRRESDPTTCSFSSPSATGRGARTFPQPWSKEGANPRARGRGLRLWRPVVVTEACRQGRRRRAALPRPLAARSQGRSTKSRKGLLGIRNRPGAGSVDPWEPFSWLRRAHRRRLGSAEPAPRQTLS